MSLSIKRGGIYAASIGVSIKRGGAYSTANVVGVFTKVGGAYISALAPPAPGQRLIVGTNWRYPTTFETIANTTETLGRNVHTFGSGDCINHCIHLPTGANGNAGDAPAGAFTGQFYLEFRGQAFPYMFGGQIARAVAAGEPGVVSDVMNPQQWGLTKFPVGEDFYIRYKLVRADATVGTVGGHVIAQDARNSCFSYNPATVTSASPVSGTGAIVVTATANLSPRSLGYSPCPLGEFVSPAGKVSFGVIGASMEDGGTDVTWTAPLVSGRGLMRATRASDGVSAPIAGGCIASAGNSTTAIGGVNTATHDFYKYFTHVEESIGGNDIGSMNGSTTRQKYFDIGLFRRQLWAIMRAKNPTIKIACLLKPPCITASADSFTTGTGQTVGTEWGMLNGSTGDTVGLGEYYRTWNVDQLNTASASVFNAAINNVIMTVSGLVQPGRRLYIGDTITASGYTGKIVGVGTTAADGSGSYSISPAVPAGLTIRAFTANVTAGTGCDYVFGTEDNTFPGRRDLWQLATTTGLGLPGDAPLGVPAPTGSGGNHPATNHYILMSKRVRRDFLGISN